MTEDMTPAGGPQAPATLTTRSHMPAIKQRSPLANKLDTIGRIEVDRYEQRCERPISTDEAGRVYRAAVGSAAQRMMRDELEPFTRAAVRHLSMSAVLGKAETQPALQEVMDTIRARWVGAASELLGHPHP